MSKPHIRMIFGGWECSDGNLSEFGWHTAEHAYLAYLKKVQEYSEATSKQEKLIAKILPANYHHTWKGRYKGA